MLEEYFLEHHSEELENILNSFEINLFHPIHVNFVSLFEADAESAQKILRNPRYYLPLCDEGAVSAQQQLAKPEQIVKKKVRIRISAVPVSINEGQIGELVSTSGITVRTSEPTVIKMTKRMNCKKCKHTFAIKLELERQTFQDPQECEACHSRNIVADTNLDQNDCSDYQEIKIQENANTATSTSYTVGMQIILLDDLVDKCRPGDRLDISGVIIRRWAPLAAGRRTEATTVLIANSVSVRRKLSDCAFSTQEVKDIFSKYWQQYKDNPLLGRDNILASICPQLYGMYTVKLAVAVVLAGGVTKCNKSGTRVRSESHLLLVGDPGTGKSQILRAASRLAVRSVLTTGVGSTSAGLTASAVKDTDGWHLEGGALVLADGGVCCVDEFTTMSAQDRASVHEAMEQQTISIAKAGLVSTLNSRCSVIAAINPEGGRFADGDEWKTRLGNPLLSRFDLILLLKDNKNPQWDGVTSDHILRSACRSNEMIAPQMDLKTHMDLLQSEGLWKEDTLREYLALVHSLRPTMTKEAEAVLSATYLYHRSNPNRKAERTTVRLLDSLIRLAEGHARLMYRTEVLMLDAIYAAELIGTASTTDKESGSSFPENPIVSYRSRGRTILNALGLEELIELL